MSRTEWLESLRCTIKAWLRFKQIWCSWFHSKIFSWFSIRSHSSNTVWNAVCTHLNTSFQCLSIPCNASWSLKMSSRDPILYREPWSLSCTTSEDRLRPASGPVHISIPLHQDYLHPFPVKLSRHKVDRSTSNCKVELTSSNCIYLFICGLSAKGCLQIETVEFTFTCKKQLFCPSSCELFGRNKNKAG